MFATPPEPDPAVLQNAPVTLVSFTLAIEAERSLKPADGVQWSKLLKEAGFSTPLLQKIEEQTVAVGQNLAGNPLLVPSSIVKRDGWRVTHESGSATLFADSCVIERQNYPGFKVFSDEIERVLVSLENLLAPSIQKRLTLKYANALSSKDAHSASFWNGKVDPSFLGIGANEHLRENLFRTFNLAEFKIDGGLIMGTRFGLQPDATLEERVAFVFEIEGNIVELIPFSREQVMTQTKELNRRARQLFQSIITPEYFEKLKADPA